MLNRFNEIYSKSEAGEWQAAVGTYDYDQEFPPSYLPAETITEFDIKNRQYLRLFEKMIRAKESDEEASGLDKGFRPFVLASPGYVSLCATTGVGFHTGKLFGNILEGELGLSAKPEHIRINGMTIMNPALLDSVPSTVVTPIPVVLFSVATGTTYRQKRALLEAMMLIQQGEEIEEKQV